jgi:hypothetical protein
LAYLATTHRTSPLGAQPGIPNRYASDKRDPSRGAVVFHLPIGEAARWRLPVAHRASRCAPPLLKSIRRSLPPPNPSSTSVPLSSSLFPSAYQRPHRSFLGSPPFQFTPESLEGSRRSASSRRSSGRSYASRGAWRESNWTVPFRRSSPGSAKVCSPLSLIDLIKLSIRIRVILRTSRALVGVLF